MKARRSTSGCGKKTATFLQLLKETAMRAGEAKRLLWTDVDFEKWVITLNYPEKGGNPRIWKVSAKLIGMLNGLPRNSVKVFGDGPINSLLLYIQIDETLFKETNDEFTVIAAKTPEEIGSLLEVGFEYVCQKDDFILFRKRK